MSTPAAPAEASPDPNGSNQSLDAISTRSFDSSLSSRSEGRRISFIGDDLRRKSVQSDSQIATETVVGNSGRQTPIQEGKLARRTLSPPPERTYQRGVSFDTFDNRDAVDFSFTLKYKHKNHQSSRRSRTFLCGTDQNDYSEFALEWLIDELVEDGDEVVCLRVVEKDSKIASDASMEEGRYRTEAEKLLDELIHKNRHDEKAISMVLELAVGKVQEIIQRMIQIYEPAVLIVGTRGRSLSGMQGLLPGSVSKYCLQQSPIPVVVVRPTGKREKKKKKRMADPTRRSYGNILQLSEQQRSGIFSPGLKSESHVAKRPDEEAAAVAEAVGLPRGFRHAHTTSDSKLSTGSTEDARDKLNGGADPDQVSPPVLEGGDERVLKSPGLADLDTPPDSESESDEQEIEPDNNNIEGAQTPSPEISPGTAAAIKTEFIEATAKAGAGEGKG